MRITAKELAVLLNGTVEGDENVWVSGPSKIEEGKINTLSFLGNSKYEHYAYITESSILLVDRNFTPSQTIKPTLLRVDNVYASVAMLLEQFKTEVNNVNGQSELAMIHAETEIDDSVNIGAFTIVSKNVKIGAGTTIHDQVYLGEDVIIGKQVHIYPGVKIMYQCVIQDYVTIHSNSVIGGDGFGFAPNADGTYSKVAQIGNVIIEEHVEIGANSTIDRGTMGSTMIRKGAKIDNLVMIAHNVEIGENTVIAAQSGIAGSTKIGKNCMIGGQVGFAGHLTIADGTKIQAQSGIAKSIKEPGTALFGSPAIPYGDFQRSHIVFKQLPEMLRRLNELEKRVSDGE